MNHSLILKNAFYDFYISIPDLEKTLQSMTFLEKQVTDVMAQAWVEAGMGFSLPFSFFSGVLTLLEEANNVLCV